MPLDIDKFEDSPHLLDIIVQMEDVLDSLDLYVYRGWFDGEVVEGPVVRRHWLSMSLLYPYRRMPDPRAALRLFKHGVRVKFHKVHRAPGEEEAGSGQEGSQSAIPGRVGAETLTQRNDDDAEDEGYWLVKIDFPRRLVGQIDAAAMDIDLYDEEVDVDDVQAAKDSGVNDESGYVDPEQAEDAEAAMGGAPGEIDRARPV